MSEKYIFLNKNKITCQSISFLETLQANVEVESDRKNHFYILNRYKVLKSY